MNTPKLLFVVYRYAGFGGIERVCRTLVRVLCERGRSVSVCAFQKASNDDPADVCGDGEIIYSPSPEPRNPTNRDFLCRVIIEHDIDIVVFHDCYQPMARHLAHIPRHVGIVVVEHNTPCIPPGWPDGYHTCFSPKRIRSLIGSVRAERWMRRRHRFLYDISDRYVLLSNRYFGEMRWVSRLNDARKLRAIPNVNTFEPLPLRPDKRREVVFLGSMLRVKGVDYLLDAWSRICQGFPEWTLRLVGDGPLRSLFEGAVSGKGLPRVEFVGSTTDVAPHLKTAAILAAPSRYEGFPMVLGEAMAHGTVPVCFDSYSALRDIVTDGMDGIIVPAFDVVAYANALKRLMSDEKLLRAMSEKALVSVERFSAKRVIPMWEALFREVMEEKRRAK